MAIVWSIPNVLYDVKGLAGDNQIKKISWRCDDTETVDLFFEDVSKMLEKKGIDIDKGNDKYTLFDDAIIEEEGF